MPFWFRAHVVLQLLGVAVAVAAFVIAIVMTPSGHHFGSTHSLLGLAVSIAGFVQPLNAFIRPKPSPRTIARQVRKKPGAVFSLPAGYGILGKL